MEASTNKSKVTVNTTADISINGQKQEEGASLGTYGATLV